jgi:hypothetical protein
MTMNKNMNLNINTEIVRTQKLEDDGESPATITDRLKFLLDAKIMVSNPSNLTLFI